MTEEDRIRYARMIAIPEIGMKGVETLKKSHVFITGCGALGSVVAMYLAGAGVGKITIADFDTIDISNLQRQLFYATSDAGKSKARILANRLSALNPECTIECIDSIITEASAPALFSQCDFIIDATDNPSSKFVTDKICHELGKPCCIGGVAGFTGQVMSWSPGHVGYSEIFYPEGVEGGFTPCSIGGVLGPAAGVIACCQASEAIKHLTDAGEMLFDKVFFIDLLTMQTRLIEVA